jgi:hypothetical protein
MPYDILPIGPAPCDEACAQAGDTDYHERSRRECRVFQRMLVRLFPIPESVPASVVVRSFPHELGRYREVCVRYAPSNGVAADWAYRIEGSAPLNWDALARNELAWLEQQADMLRAIECGEFAASELPAEFRHGDIPTFAVDAP